MAQLCEVSGVVRDKLGVVAGAVIQISRARVANARDTTYETYTTTDSNGVFSFTVPQGAQIRFASNDVTPINGWNYEVPNTVAASIGSFKADPATEVSAREGGSIGSILAAAAPYVSVREYGDAAGRKLVFTLNALPVTLVKNGTSTGGGGTQFFTFNEGLILPGGGSSNLTIAADGDKSFLAAVGMAAADTGGTLSSTEISFLPSTAATTTSGAGTCKMRSTATTPAPGTNLDGTGTPIPVFLNACLNADATGVEDLTFSGTITILATNLGDY